MLADSFSSLSCSVGSGPRRDVSNPDKADVAQEGDDIILHICTAACVGSVNPYFGMHMKGAVHIVLDASQLEITVGLDKCSG